MRNVLVLDADQRSALAVTRSLGIKNIRVITADIRKPTLSGSSKYSTASEIHPSPDNEREYIQGLCEIVNKHQIGMIIPITEISLFTVLSNRTAFGNIDIPFGSGKNIHALSDKANLVKVCSELCLPVPKSLECQPDDQRNGVDATDFHFPVVLKPYKSRIYSNGKWLGTSVRYAYTAKELAELQAEDPAFRDHSYLIQEYIVGDGAGVFLLYDHGHCIAQFSHRRLREKPPSGGVSVLSESVPMNNEMLTVSRKLLDHFNWHGLAMVEFKVTTDGKPYIMEVNTRFWGSLQLAIDAGVDFPYLLYLMNNEPGYTGIQTNYRNGARLRWLLGDLDRLYLVLKARDHSLKQKLKELLTFLMPFVPGQRYEINRLSDMSPFYYELKQYVKAIFQVDS